MRKLQQKLFDALCVDAQEMYRAFQKNGFYTELFEAVDLDDEPTIGLEIRYGLRYNHHRFVYFWCVFNADFVSQDIEMFSEPKEIDWEIDRLINKYLLTKEDAEMEVKDYIKALNNVLEDYYSK